MFKTLRARGADLKKSLAIIGWLETLKLSYSTLADFGFDKKIGMPTAEPKFVLVPVKVNGEVHEGSQYLPTRGKPFQEFLKRSKFSKSYTFVDLGCGRGRVMWLAKSYGFTKVAGIEIDGELAADCTKNLKSKGLKEGVDFEVHHINAADYLPSSNENIYFFYGPYMSDQDLKSAIENLQRKKQETGHDQFVVYHCNVQPTELLSQMNLNKIGDERISGNRFLVYKV